MESQKIYLGDRGGSDTSAILASALQNKGLDASSVMAALGNRGGLGGDLGDIIALVVIASLFGNGNGFGGGNNSAEREMIMSAINRNGLDISTIASTLNCSIGQVNAGINNLATQMCNIGSQVGLSGQQVINAIQLGNNQLSSQLAACCCDMRNAVTTQGFENRLAIQDQTNTLSNLIAAQNTMINDKFCALEQRELQSKIEALREQNSTLQTQITIGNQTAQVNQIVAAATTPIINAVNALQNEISGIKCKLPEYVSVQKNEGIYLPTCVAAQYGFYGGLPGNASVWG